MSAALVLDILRDGETLESRPVSGELVLGRSEDCAIRLDDRAVSRFHATLKPVDGGLQVQRKSDFAPILVNGSECTHAVIKSGDVIDIGPYRLRLAGSQVSKVEPPIEMPADPVAEIAEFPANEPLVSGDGLAGVPEGDPAPSEPVAGEPILPADAVDAFAQTAPLPEGDAFAADQPVGDALVLDPGQAGTDPFAAAGLGEAPPQDELMEQPLGQAPGEITLSQPEEVIPEDAPTRTAPPDALEAKLIFGQDDANVSEFQVGDQEVSIGRGKECDVILNNKKASRKHAVIRKVDGRFVIEDQGSANGTYVNGKKIKSYELTGDDRIKIGGAEYQFVVSSPEYLRREGGFVGVDDDTAAAADEALPDFAVSFEDAALANAIDPAEAAQYALEAPADLNGPAYPAPSAIPGMQGQTPAYAPAATPSPLPAGLMGIPGLAQKKPAQSSRKRILLLLALVVLAYFEMEDELMSPTESEQKPAAAAAVSAQAPSGPTFDGLPKDKQEFVKKQYDLAFQHFQNSEFDKSLYEVRQIFPILPEYELGRELERYALEGKRKLEALEEERQKLAEQEKLKARVAQLVDEAKVMMEGKRYEDARALFHEILSIEPDNAQVAAWKAEVEAWEEQKRQEEMQRQVQEEINRRGWEEYREGVALKKQGKRRSAIVAFSRVREIGASDRKLLAASDRMIALSLKEIAEKREPVLAEARGAEESGEHKRAFDLYRQATRIDADHPEGYRGMKRLRELLRERSRVLYAEGVMAESYSDFETAKSKFEEVLANSPKDDLYFERAQRKLSNYFNREPASTP